MHASIALVLTVLHTDFMSFSKRKSLKYDKYRFPIIPRYYDLYPFIVNLYESAKKLGFEKEGAETIINDVAQAIQIQFMR